MINFSTVSNKIFKVLKGHGYRIKMYTDEGMETVDPDVGRWFFVKDPNMMISLSDKNEEIIMNKNSTIELSIYEDVLRQIKSIATHYILNFTIRNFEKDVEPKGFSPQAKKLKAEKAKLDSISESSFSKFRGSKKTSVQSLEGVKVIVKHHDVVDETVRGSRSRNIKSIFIENNGERFSFPHKSLNGARAMARHIQCGGSMSDVVGKHICTITENCLKLVEFYRQIKHQHLINENNIDTIDLIRENITSIKRELNAFSGSKTYNMAKSMVSEQEIIQEEGDIESLRDMFTVKQFNEQFEGVMELLNNMVNTNKAKMLKIQEAANTEILCRCAPLAEDVIVEYTSKSAKLGNKLINLSSVMIGNKDLVEFIVKVGKKMISEQTLTDFETDIVKNVLTNVVIEKKLPVETKDLIESYINKLELSLSKHEYPHLMKLSESRSKPMMRYNRDMNGNKLLVVNSPDYGAMSIQTNGNLPLIHSERVDLQSSEAYDEIDAYVSQYGTQRQKQVWQNYSRSFTPVKEGMNRYADMSEQEWKAEYARLEGAYKRAEESGRFDAAERIADKLSDMEMYCRWDDKENDLFEAAGDIVVKNDGDIVGSFLREFDYGSWGISYEDMRDLNMFYQESMGDRVNVSESDVAGMMVEIMERAEKDGMYLAFNDQGDIIETSDDSEYSLTESTEEDQLQELQDSMPQMKALIMKVYNKWKELSTMKESMVTEWKYKGSSIDLPEHILDDIKKEIDVLVMQYKAAIEGIKLANKLKGTPNGGQKYISRVMSNRNRIWSRLNKLDRMLNSIER